MHLEWHPRSIIQQIEWICFLPDFADEIIKAYYVLYNLKFINGVIEILKNCREFVYSFMNYRFMQQIHTHKTDRSDTFLGARSIPFRFKYIFNYIIGYFSYVDRIGISIFSLCVWYVITYVVYLCILYFRNA